MTRSRVLGISALLPLFAAPALGQLRVAEWNITNYSSGRVSEFETAIYDSFGGRTMAPDILVVQELEGSTGLFNFLNILNNAPGSPGDWAAAPIVNSNDTENGFYYRTSRIDFIGVTTVSAGSGPPNHPRNLERYDVRPVGYSADSTTLACYSSHMKAGSTSGDQDRRLVEAIELRDDSNALPDSWNFLVCADFNIQSSSQAAYQEMVGSQADNTGRFFDPIARAGNWNNSSSFRFLHTQDPAGLGGMDDRHDQILISTSLRDGSGFEYIGNTNIGYSNSTWNDPNHSYRAWGNDGSSFNSSLTVNSNAMVGPTIAQALIDSTDGAGHLPVFLDLRLPPEVGASTFIDFGTVPVTSSAQASLNVSNAGNVILWTANGIADLEYTLSAPPGFGAPGGSFVASAGAGNNVHTITMDTTVAGPKMGTLQILSNSPDQPVRNVTLVGTVSGTNPFPNFCHGDGGDQMGCTDCPCGNNAPQGTLGGCLNSNGTPGRLLVSGTPSVANDTLRFELTGGTPTSFALLSSGTAQAPNNPANPCFAANPASGIQAQQFDGLRCVVQNFLRHGTRPSDTNGDIGVTTSAWGPPDGPFMGLLFQASLMAGQTRYFQVIYREDVAQGCMRGANTSQGIQVEIVP